MKKTLLAIILLITVNLFSQVREKTVTFNNLIDNKLYPVTGLTIDSLRLVSVEGAYSGYVIYPDNVTGATLTNNGNGQYVMKYFIHSNFTSTIGSGYKYYVKLQRKISTTWTDQNQYGYFWIGDFGENIDRLQLSSDTANNMRLWKAQTVYGLKSFSDGIKTNTLNSIGSELNIGTTGKVYMGNSTYGTPMTLYSPKYNNSFVTKGWTQSEIDTRLAGVLAGNYIESPNVVRLMPNGTETASQIYLTYKAALDYGTMLSGRGLDKQITVLVCGNGTSASYITPTLGDSGRYAIDYVHFKGLGNNVVLRFTDHPAENEFKGLSNDKIIYEGLTFNLNVSEASNLYFENITFMNCNFVYGTGTIAAVNFTGCRFEGTNYFTGFTDNVLTFTNCIGTSIYSTSTVVTTGTNIIPYQTPLLISVKSLFLGNPFNRTNAENYSIFRDTTNRLMFKQSTDTIYHLINECEEILNKTTIYTLTTSAVALEAFTLPYAGKWKIDIFFEYEFATDSIINWGTSDSIDVYIDNTEPPTLGHWVKKIYNPYNTKYGERGTGYISAIFDGGAESSGNIYGKCTENALNSSGVIKRRIQNLRIVRTLIK